MFDTSHLNNNLGGRAVRGGIITILGQFTKTLLQTGSLAVLARLLNPSDFGLIAKVMVVVAFATIFRDLGLSTATIQKTNINEKQVSALFWLSTILGIGIMLSLMMASPVIAWFYEDERLIRITLVISVMFFFWGIVSQHQALLKRQMRFKTLAIIEVLAMGGAVIFAIVCAFMDFGYWALIIRSVMFSFLFAVGTWVVSGWIPKLPVRGSGVMDMIKFGGNITGFKFVNYFSRNLDTILIGKYCPDASLGYYNSAYQMMVFPIQQINRPLESVSLPVLSLLQDDGEKYRRYYMKMVSLLLIVCMPMMTFAIIAADDLILLILGDQWSQSVSIFRWLAIVGIVQPLGSTTGALMMSQGRGKELFRWGILGSSISILSFFIGIRWGALGVAAVYSLSGLLIRTPLLFWFAGKNGPVTIRDFYKVLIVPSYISVMVFCVLFLLHYFVAIDNVLLMILISLCVTAGVSVLGLSFTKEGRNKWHDVLDIVNMIRKRNPDSVEA